MTYKKNIEFALFLIESLDSSFHIGPPQNMKISQEHKDADVSVHTEYELDGGKSGTMTILKRKGSYEIHHHVAGTDQNDRISGLMLNHSKYNAKFVGTMYHVAKRLIDSGKTVRIVGNHTNGMFDHYNRMASVLAKRSGYHVSSASTYEHPSPDSKNFSQIVVSKPTRASVLNEILIATSKQRVKSNNYGLGSGQEWLNPRTITVDELVEGLLEHDL